MKHLYILNFATSGGGAHGAALRLHLALRRHGEDYGLSSTLRVIKSDHHDTQGLVSGYPSLNCARTLKRWGQIRLRQAKKVSYRLMGGKHVFSSARIRTGIAEEINREEPDLLMLNWLGDYSECLEGIAELGHPLFLRNPDLWFVNGGYHFPPASEEVGPGMTRADSFFFQEEDRQTTERKERLLWPLVEATISPSIWLAEQVHVSGRMPHARHETVLNALDMAKWRPERSRASMRDSRRRRTIRIGMGSVNFNHDVRKGRTKAMQIARELAQMPIRHTNDVEFVVFGGKKGKWEYEGFRFFGLGKLTELEMKEFYSEIDVFLIVSAKEGFPNTAMEAQAFGKPVVGLECGPIAEACAIPSLIVKKPDPRGVAMALCDAVQIARDPQTAEGIRHFVDYRHNYRTVVETLSRVLSSN